MTYGTRFDDVLGRQADVPGLRGDHEQDEDRRHGQKRQREGADDLADHVALEDIPTRRPPCLASLPAVNRSDPIVRRRDAAASGWAGVRRPEPGMHSERPQAACPFDQFGSPGTPKVSRMWFFGRGDGSAAKANSPGT